MSDEAIVYVIEDDEGMRKSLQLTLSNAGFAVRAYPTSEAFLEHYDAEHGGCLVLDLRMRGMSGLELEAHLREQGDDVPIVFLTGHGNVASAVRAMKLGAVDFLEKPMDPYILVDRVRGALRDASRRHERRGEVRQIRERLEQLTPREREILTQLVAGRVSKQIARQLAISERTVSNHRARLLEKMGAANTADLVRMVVTAESA